MTDVLREFRDEDGHGGEDDRSQRIDVGDGVEREPPGPLGRVVAVEQGHHAVADLVEDDGDEQAAVEDEVLAGHAGRVTGGTRRS